MAKSHTSAEQILYGRIKGRMAHPSYSSSPPPATPDRLCRDNNIVQHLLPGTEVRDLDDLAALYRRLASDAAQLRDLGWSLEPTRKRPRPKYRLLPPSG